MYWDRFNICEAYYLFMTLHHGGQWSKEYRLTGTFDKIDFRPSPLLSKPSDLGENAREIYDRLASGETSIRDRREN